MGSSARYNERKGSCLGVLLACALILLYCLDTWVQDAYAAPIADRVLRLHILANSDRQEDQELKLLVRDGILELFQENLSSGASREEAEAWALAHEEDITKTAREILREKGCEDTVTMEVRDCYFPVRTYGELVFPCGMYRALRVVIGNGAGHNWWCVLSPGLCVGACSSTSEEGKQELENRLGPEEYGKLTGEEGPKAQEGTKTQNDDGVSVTYRLWIVEWIRALADGD